MNAKEAIKKLRIDSDIVITGPDCTDPGKLRIYANGGLIGKLYVGDRKNGVTELISSEYCKYPKPEGGNKELKNLVAAPGDAVATLASNKYIEACKKSVEARFGEKTSQGEKERHVQTRIVKRFMENGDNWCVVDMEVQCPKKWFAGNHFSKGTTAQPRFDMIVLNRDGIGVIELKVDNDNTDNMNSHYEHMTYLLDNSDCQTLFLDEMNRRITIMNKHGLLCKNAAAFPQNKIWCGFLFVGGGIDGSKELVKQFKGKPGVNHLKFLYCPDSANETVQTINMDQAMSYETFMKQ